MSETNIAHAIATFSELGIGAGLVWLGDVVSLRAGLTAQLIVAKESRRVTQADYDTKADGFDPTLGAFIRAFMWIRETFFSSIIAFLLGLLRWSPYCCIGFGVYALFGIALYPTAFNMTPSFFIFNPEVLNLIYFTMSILSFIVVCIPAVAMITRKIINWYALKDIEIK